MGVVSHDSNIHDNHTLPEVLFHIESSQGKEVKHAVCDRGYRGKKTFGNTEVILPAPPLKRDNRYQRDKKRKRCRRRAAIEPIIGHLKTDFRLTRNFLKGVAGDTVNLLMAACAWNMAKRGVAIFAKACFGHPSPSKRQKLNATTIAFGAPAVLRTCHFATPS